jgi:PIN domain nuclease of toxin-antitoxin system
MEVLVDTHVLLWAMTEPERLTAAAEEALADLDTSVWVSAASSWEIATKVRIGKLPGAEFLVVDYGEHLRRWHAESIPILSADALVAGSLVWEHRDPFDRMIAAQSLRRGLPLVSADAVFDAVPGVHRIW